MNKSDHIWAGMEAYEGAIEILIADIDAKDLIIDQLRDVIANRDAQIKDLEARPITEAMILEILVAQHESKR